MRIFIDPTRLICLANHGHPPQMRNQSIPAQEKNFCAFGEGRGRDVSPGSAYRKYKERE